MTLYKYISKIILFVFKEKKNICTKEPAEIKTTCKMYIESIRIILDTLSEYGRLTK